MNIPAPGFNLASVGSPTKVSSSLLAGRAVVVNFWASWCPACQAEMPTLEAAHRALGNSLTFVGIAERDTRGPAIDFLRQVGVTYPNGFDGSGDVGQSYSLSGTPETYFISYGKVQDISVGPVTSSTLSSYLKHVFDISWSARS